MKLGAWEIWLCMQSLKIRIWTKLLRFFQTNFNIIVMEKCISLGRHQTRRRFSEEFSWNRKWIWPRRKNFCSENGRLGCGCVGVCDEHVMCVVYIICAMFWNIAAFQCGGWVTRRVRWADVFTEEEEQQVVGWYLLSLHSSRSGSESENQIRTTVLRCDCTASAVTLKRHKWKRLLASRNLLLSSIDLGISVAAAALREKILN